jgi:hypothetical protein
MLHDVSSVSAALSRAKLAPILRQYSAGFLMERRLEDGVIEKEVVGEPDVDRQLAAQLRTVL